MRSSLIVNAFAFTNISFPTFSLYIYYIIKGGLSPPILPLNQKRLTAIVVA